MPKKLTLTDKQWEIVELMRDRWELGATPFERFPCWIQKDGLGKGGKWKRVNKNIFNSLCKKNIISQEYIRSNKWQLTELGKTLTREE